MRAASTSFDLCDRRHETGAVVAASPAVDGSPSLSGPISVYKYDGGYDDQKFIIEFGDNRRILVSARMAELVGLIDGVSTTEQIAARLADKWGSRVSASQVDQVISATLVTTGIVHRPRVLNQPIERRWPDLLGHSLKLTLIPSRIVRRITPWLEPIYCWPVVVIGLMAIMVSRFILYANILDVKEMAGTPDQYLYVFLVIFLTVIIHEFGHAAAVGKWGGRPGDIGLTLYFLFPALFTDTSDSWRFGRWQRAAVDAGGAYFQLLSSLVLVVVYLINHSPIALLACVAMDSLLALSLNPFFKFDGYWVVSDILGVPNLHKNSLRQLGSLCLRVFSKGSSRQTAERMNRWTEVLLSLYGALLLLFITVVTYLTFTYGVNWILKYPDLVAGVWEGVSHSSKEQAAVVAGILLRFLYQTAVLIGLLVFWYRLATNAWRMLQGRLFVNRAGIS